jgi:hypothetical protein
VRGRRVRPWNGGTMEMLQSVQELAQFSIFFLNKIGQNEVALNHRPFVFSS